MSRPLQPAPTPARVGVTLGWAILLTGFVRWWELVLWLDGFLVWTGLFVVAYIGTFGVLERRAVLSWQHRAWPPVVAWLAIAFVVWGLHAWIPTVRLAGQAIGTIAFVGTLDFVIPIWIVARALVATWTGSMRWVILGATPVYAGTLFWALVVQMPGASYAGPPTPLSDAETRLRDAMERHVRVLAADIGERSDATYRSLTAAERYLDSTLAAMGMNPAVQEFTVGGRVYRNVIVEVPGTRSLEEILVVGAHYDTAEGAPGADDNASGTAALLELVRVFHGARPARTLRFVFFANEEPPYFNTEWMGSWVHAARAAAARERIAAMISLETVGYYSSQPGSQRYPPPFNLFYPDRGEFIAFVGNLGSRSLVRRSLRLFRDHARFPSEGVASPAWVPGVTWSDHASFWLHGYRAIMITDTAPFRNPHYHRTSDTPDKLDFERMARVVHGIASVIRGLSGAT